MKEIVSLKKSQFQGLRKNSLRYRHRFIRERVILLQSYVTLTRGNIPNSEIQSQQKKDKRSPTEILQENKYL